MTATAFAAAGPIAPTGVVAPARQGGQGGQGWVCEGRSGKA